MPGPTYEDILTLTHEVQMDIRAANGKLTTIRSWLAAQPITKRTAYICPRCGLDRGGQTALEDHLVNVHGEERLDAYTTVIRIQEAA